MTCTTIWIGESWGARRGLKTTAHCFARSSKLARLGWHEEVAWDDGLRRTVDWYRCNSGNWGDLTQALVAHPRRGLTAAEMYQGSR